MPSAYPSYPTSIPVFTGKFGDDIIASNSTNFFVNITREINRRIVSGNGKKRAVLVFFQKESILEDFSASDAFKQYTASALKIVSKTLPEDRDSAIARAVEEGRVTLLIAAYGRGTDFTYNNKELDERGGIHVIQAFLSEESAEETQIMGRTNRQGHPGSFSMVLSDSDFEAVGIKPSDVTKHRLGQEIFSQIKNFRSTTYAKKCVQRKELADFMRIEHEESEKIIEELCGNNLAGVKDRIAARNQARIEFVRVVSRTVILLDATCSMVGFFSKCKTIVKEMLKRISEILKEQKVTYGFEVQFVVYRNYPSKTLLLQASDWESDPEALKEFIDKTEVSGGVGGNESIETAFWFVNQQIEKGVDVTQVIIIGDQGPNSLNEVAIHRGGVESDNLKGEEYWKQKTVFKEKTHYKPELKKIKEKSIPIHARYLNVNGSFPAKASFEEFAKDNGGSASELQIDKPQGADQLTGLLAAGILKNIQSRSKDKGVDLYGAYLAKHPHADVGFV